VEFRKLLAVVVACVPLLGCPAQGQTTTVTAAVVDSDSTPWVNATCTTILQAKQTQFPPVTPYRTDTGNPVPTAPVCAIDGSGNLTSTLTDVAFIMPANSTWQFTICPAVFQPKCGVVNIPVTGASENVSSQLTAGIPAPRIGGGFGQFAYADVEVLAIPNNSYYNTVSAAIRCYGASWGACGTGGGGGSGTVTSFTAGTLSPLFTTNVNTASTTPALTFLLTNAPANTVFGNLTGSPAGPIYNTTLGNLSTTGNAGTATALAATPTICGSANAPRGVDASGNALDCQAISGGGGGATLQVNTVNTLSQSLQNLTNTGTVAFTNPSGGVVSAAIVSPGASTLLGFNSSNAYTGFTLGTGLSFSGTVLNATGGGGNLTGTLTANLVPVASGANTLVNGTITDNGAGAGVSIANNVTIGAGTTPTTNALTAGTGNVPAGGQPSNSQGFIAADCGTCTAYFWGFPGTATAGYVVAAAPATVHNVNVSRLSIQGAEGTISGNVNTYGNYGVSTFLGGTKMNNAGHFTNLQVTNTSTGACTTAPAINVQDVTTSTNGSAPVTGSTTGNVGGTGSATQDGNPGLTYSAGDDVRIYISTAGSGCAGSYFTVSAQYETP
jgi:hypothetical protein